MFELFIRLSKSITPGGECDLLIDVLDDAIQRQDESIKMRIDVAVARPNSHVDVEERAWNTSRHVRDSLAYPSHSLGL